MDPLPDYQIPEMLSYEDREGVLFWHDEQYTFKLTRRYSTPIIDINDHHLNDISFTIIDSQHKDVDPDNDNILVFFVSNNIICKFEVVYDKEEDVIQRMCMYSEMYKNKEYKVIAAGYSCNHPLSCLKECDLLEWYDCCSLFDSNFHLLI